MESNGKGATDIGRSATGVVIVTATTTGSFAQLRERRYNLRGC